MSCSLDQIIFLVELMISSVLNYKAIQNFFYLISLSLSLSTLLNSPFVLLIRLTLLKISSFFWILNIILSVMFNGFCQNFFLVLCYECSANF